MPSQLVNSKETESKLINLDLDYIFVFTFPILGKNIFSIPHKGTINFHSSLLPERKGPNPLFWATHENDKNLGVTFHFINEKIDDGPIIKQIKLPSFTKYDSEIVENIIFSIGSREFCKLILELMHNELFVSKEHKGKNHSYQSIPDQELRFIDCNMNFDYIKNIVKTFSGYGLARFKYRENTYKIIEAVELKTFKTDQKVLVKDNLIYIQGKDDTTCLLVSTKE